MGEMSCTHSYVYVYLPLSFFFYTYISITKTPFVRFTKFFGIPAHAFFFGSWFARHDLKKSSIFSSLSFVITVVVLVVKGCLYPTRGRHTTVMPRRTFPDGFFFFPFCVVQQAISSIESIILLLCFYYFPLP